MVNGCFKFCGYEAEGELKMEKVELLAPAGSLEKLKIAVLYGADAVYIGGEKFSLRTAAENFSRQEMEEGIRFAHKYGVKVYAALNVIPHNDMLEKLTEYAAYLAGTDIDGVIVADLGAFAVIRETAPSLEVHVSTQANTVNSASACAWYKMGAKRVVLARELSMNEVSEIRDKTPVGLELEMFVHGAMCVSYSGRCLLSNYMIQRDSNMGNCAQPCRWKYNLVEEKRPGEYMPVYENENGTFIFNSKDLCLIKRLPEIIKSGVSSLKIEGRVKSEYYVASVVKVYREAIDEYYADPENFEFKQEWYDELCKVSHREYWEGFYFGGRGREGQIYGSSSYIREYDIIGIVRSFDEQTGIAEVSQRNRFFRGDKIEVIQPLIPGYFEYTVDFLQDEKGIDINSAPHADMKLKMNFGRHVAVNSIIRKGLD